MANGLEVRVPFMDYRIVRLSQLLNGQQKQTPEDFKIFLKEALGKRCPPQLLTCPKWGFSTTLKNWVSQPEVFACIQRDSTRRVRAHRAAERRSCPPFYAQSGKCEELRP